MDYWVLIENGTAAEWGLLCHCVGLLGSGERAVALLRDGLSPEKAFAFGAGGVFILTGISDVACTADRIVQLALAEKPEAILYTADERGRMTAARVAAKLGVGLAADCTDLRRDNGQLVMTRPTFGGTLMADIVCPMARPQTATVRPGTYLPEKPLRGISDGRISRVEVTGKDMVTLIEDTLRPNDDPGTADIVVAGGKGIGSREGFDLLAKLANRLGGAVGASRAAVNAGYASYRAQIGLTGITVRPRVYLALGISGAVQHVVAMERSGLVLAVNTDGRAAIFEYADYGIVGDWREFVEQLMDRL